ncbi:adenylate/guanylate cyclase [Rhizobiales bacterium GAS188]|nr:adenylate/guanylate cyclase [Rhizobiales bacterium GAS188]
MSKPPMAEMIEQWLVTQGLDGGRVIEIMDGFCERLAEGGFPLARGLIGLRTLHPQLGAVGFLWQRDEGGVETEHIDHQDGEFAKSPFAQLKRLGGTLRRRLSDPSCPRDFPVLAELAEAGMTDYFCAVVPFGDMAEGNGLMTSWATDRRSGFAETEIERLVDLLSLLALAVKASAAPRVSRSLLSIYLGHDAGDRVLSGTIQRGSMQSVSAVLYYADLAGFTGFADKAESAALMAALDVYLEAMAVPVELSGGQILKYIGDGLLATFALADFDGEAEPAVAAALDAAEDALARVATINAERQAAGEPFMDLDIALHLGDVLYGNVGTDERLDFTVIGPAVNEASRIEALCGTLDQRVLASAALAEAAGGERYRLKSLGRQRLRGVTEPQELFGLAARASPTDA